MDIGVLRRYIGQLALATKRKSTLVDTGLILGLILAVGFVYGVETRLPRPELIKGQVGKKVIGLTGTSTYSIRTKKNKTEWVAQFGGSPQTEGCVQLGLDWLVRHQAEDGSWSNACLGPKRSNSLTLCEGDQACTVPGQRFATSQTGLALLALQAAGNYECNNESYSKQVRRGLDWLAKHQQPDGALLGPMGGRVGNYGHNFMYQHAMGAFALAEACAVRKAQHENDLPRLTDAAVKAIQFIERQQHDDGGWRYTTHKQERGDTSVSGWAMLALKSAKEADLPVDPETVRRTKDFFRGCESGGRTGYVAGGGGSDALVGVGMLTHLLLLKDPQDPLVKISADHLAAQANTYRNHVRQGRAEFYTLYNATLAMFLAGGENWNTWNSAVRDGVVALQVQGAGCERGSWDPRGTNGGGAGGRIYSTALATLMLEVYYRFSREGQGTVADAPH